VMHDHADTTVAQEQEDSQGRFGFSKRRHKCQYCPKAFVTPSKLERHERIHTGSKPFGCEMCSQRFTQRCGLKVHSHLHARELMSTPAEGDARNIEKLDSEINGFLVCELVSAMQRSTSRRTTGGPRSADSPPAY
jgi:uncharacterized Zn-finger protein